MVKACPGAADCMTPMGESYFFSYCLLYRCSNGKSNETIALEGRGHEYYQ